MEQILGLMSQMQRKTPGCRSLVHFLRHLMGRCERQEARLHRPLAWWCRVLLMFLWFWAVANLIDRHHCDCATNIQFSALPNLSSISSPYLKTYNKWWWVILYTLKHCEAGSTIPVKNRKRSAFQTIRHCIKSFLS